MTAYVAHIGFLVVDLHVPDAQSLKQKRSVIKSIKERIKNNFNVSVAELGEHDKWQRAVIGIIMLGNDKSYVESILSKIRDKISMNPGSHLIDSQIQWL
ncbi:MAG: DUF503 domain-containing protein [Bdellovibrionales bacterium]|nr:DUF503 domain-containing protein [Bdellovibrionales bacterium]